MTFVVTPWYGMLLDVSGVNNNKKDYKSIPLLQWKDYKVYFYYNEKITKEYFIRMTRLQKYTFITMKSMESLSELSSWRNANY